jgi:hypothetical protein
MVAFDIIGGLNIPTHRLFKMLIFFDQFPLPSALPIKDINIHKANSIGKITGLRLYIGGIIVISC